RRSRAGQPAGTRGRGHARASIGSNLRRDRELPPRPPPGRVTYTRPRMINITPDPVAFTIGSFPIHWYGICYAVGLALVYFVLVSEARRRGEDEAIVGNALIIVA